MFRQISLNEAARLVADSSVIALGGMTVHRRPVSFVLELLRRQQRPRDLTLLTFTASYESDLLVGAGCISTVRTVYFGLDVFGFAPMFTQAANNGQITIQEETELSLVCGLRAQMSGASHMPSSAWVGTDLPALRPDVKTIVDPYSDEPLMAFPAIRADIAILHALEADDEGNIKLNNNLCVDLELVYISDLLIVTVERFVDKVHPSTDGVIIPAPMADYIIPAPKGAWPTSCYPYYPLGGGELLRYIDACNCGEFEQYLAASVSWQK